MVEQRSLDAFRSAAEPGVRTPALRALWHATRGDWATAHAVAQDHEDTHSAWVHAMLHRQEGDDWNAAYWYRRAGKPVFRGELNEEMVTMLSALLPAAV